MTLILAVWLLTSALIVGALAMVRLALDLHDTRQALAIVIHDLHQAGLLDVGKEEL